jgi:hypothetical protein
MREEDDLIEQARRSREETEQLREESGLGSGDTASEDDATESGGRQPREGEPWAKTSSGDAEHVTDDD